MPSPPPGPLRASPAATFTPGPGLDAAEPLLAWLQASAQPTRRLLRLPVVLRFDEAPRSRVEQAVIGASEAALDAEQAIELRLDDSGRGVAAIDELRRVCPADATVCVLWLEGLWGPLVPGLGGDDGAWPFALRSIGPPLSPQERQHPAAQRVWAAQR